VSDIQLRPASSDLTNALVAITGPAGSGKSYGALLLAHGLGQKIVVIDTELRPNRRGDLRGRSETYAGKVALDGSGMRLSFSVIPLAPPWTIARYMSALHTAWSSGADVVVIDSISHEWSGVLDRVDQLKRSTRNGMSAWQTATPEHQAFIDALLTSPSHMVCTIRSKMTTAEVEENGQKKFKKVGFQPIQRDGVEYEFELLLDVDYEHRAFVTKANAGYSRDLDEFMASPKGGKITVELGRRLKGWLDGGQAAPRATAPEKAPGAVVPPESPPAAAPGAPSSPLVEALGDLPEFPAKPIPQDPTPTPAAGVVVPPTIGPEVKALTAALVGEKLAALKGTPAAELVELVHARPNHVDEKLSTHVLKVVASTYGTKLATEMFRAVGGQTENRRRIPLTGAQLGALVLRLPPAPAGAPPSSQQPEPKGAAPVGEGVPAGAAEAPPASAAPGSPERGDTPRASSGRHDPTPPAAAKEGSSPNAAGAGDAGPGPSPQGATPAARNAASNGFASDRARAVAAEIRGVLGDATPEPHVVAQAANAIAHPGPLAIVGGSTLARALESELGPPVAELWTRCGGRRDKEGFAEGVVTAQQLSEYWLLGVLPLVRKQVEAAAPAPAEAKR
jgi:hypothetical protein